MSKYGVISGPYFPVFGVNTGKSVPGITPYLGTFHAVKGYQEEGSLNSSIIKNSDIHAFTDCKKNI